MEKHLNTPCRNEFFGFGWEFHYGDLKADAVFDKPDFRPVQLPHDWLMDYEAPDLDPKSGAMNWKYGVGMYRKAFTLGEACEGKRILLHFDGAYQDATVWLNGVQLGNHFYGYTPFEYDITEAADLGGINRLVVRVDNSDQPNTRWYSGSGIDRDVWISAVNPVHTASEGTYIVTKALRNGFAELSIETEIMNQSEEDCEILVVNEIYAPDGKLAAKLPAKLTLGEACETAVLKQEIALREPALWSTEHPAMHKMLTKIYLGGGGEPVDVYTTPFGIRTICFDADGGFLLNGKHVKINGMAIHNEAGQLGAAVPKAVWKRRFEKLQEMGCNAIRTAHNPADPGILDLMDEMGLLCMDEFFDEWTICKWSKSRGNPDVPPKGYAHRFEEFHEKDCETIVRRDKNHPCVILWSVGNECEEVYTVDGWEVMKALREIVHRLDPTRPVTEGTNLLAHNSGYTYEKFMEYEDVWGFNWINIWEPRAELLYEPDKIKHPDVPMVITETGGCQGSRGNYPLPERRQKGRGPFGGSPYYSWPVAASKHLRFIMTHDYISGVFYWTGVDYMGESPYPMRGGEHAPVGLDGYIKDNWYFYKSMWKHDEPMVYIFPHWNMDVPEGKVIPVLCYTSCPSVELFVNGKSFGEKAYLYPADGIDEWPKFDLTKPSANTDDLFLSWDVPYEKGEVTALGYDRDGKEIAHYTVRTVGEAEKIAVSSDRTEILADGRDVAQIEIELQDRDGNFAILSENELKVSVEGPAELLVVENGNGRDHSLGRNPVRKAHYGRLFAVVRSKRGEEGTISISVSGEGLSPDTICLESKNQQ